MHNNVNQPLWLRSSGAYDSHWLHIRSIDLWQCRVNAVLTPTRSHQFIRFNWIEYSLESVKLNRSCWVQFNTIPFFYILQSNWYRELQLQRCTVHIAPSKLFRNFWLQLQLISIWFSMRSFDNVAFHLLFLRQHMYICTHTHTPSECCICGDGGTTSNTHPFKHSNRIALFSFFSVHFFARLTANLEHDSAHRKFRFYFMHTIRSYRAQ